MEIKIDRKRISYEGGNVGLEIRIPGVLGNPTDPEGMPCPIYIEEIDGKIQIHIWDGEQDPQTIILTNS